MMVLHRLFYNQFIISHLKKEVSQTSVHHPRMGYIIFVESL